MDIFNHYRVGEEVWAVLADGSQDHVLPEGSVLMTPQEVEEHVSQLVPPLTLESLPPVSIAQIRSALILRGVITREEGRLWAAGVLPESLQVVIDTLPEVQQVVAEQRALTSSIVEPTDPIVGALAVSQGMTLEDLIDLFQFAHGL